MVMKRALVITGVIEIQYLFFLQRAKHALGWGWRMGIEVVIDCAQPDGWKITSVNPNVKQFLSGDGS